MSDDSPLRFRFQTVKKTEASKLLANFVESGGRLCDLANRLGVSDWTVYRWARGVTNPQGLYAKVLQKEVGELAAAA